MPEALRNRSWELLLAAVLVATMAYNTTQSDAYLDVDNFVNLFHLSIEKVIVAVIMTFVIVSGEIDLSVASMMAFAAAVMATLHDGGMPFPLAMAVALLAATAGGFLQGVVIARTGLPSLVVTLAGLIAFRGAARVLVEDRSVGDFPEWFERLGRRDLVGPLPFSVVLFFAGLVVGAVVLHRTAFGRKVYVIGNNAEVARYSGIDVGRVKVALFTASGLVAGIAGVLFAARLGSVRANIGDGFELDIVTIVLLGGVSIFGGTGNLVGVGLSIFVVLNLRNGLSLARVEDTIQTGVVGGLLIVSVLAQNLLDRVLTFTRVGGRPAGVHVEGPDDTFSQQPQETRGSP
jgi:rhamnose transport system permease protein